MLFIAYSAAALLFVFSLTAMLLYIGKLMSTCPVTGPAAKVASITIATGFASIGAGGAILIAALIPLMAEVPSLASGAIATGLAAFCLGLGFTQAVATLQAVVNKGPAVPVAEASPA